MKYREILSKSDKDKVEEEIDYAVEEAKMQIDADIHATKKSISHSKRSLDRIKASIPFDSGAILNASRDLKGYEEGLSYLEKLKKELF